MKNRELIALLLQQNDPDAPIHFCYDYGDHWYTQVAPEVKSVRPGRVVFSEYHRMPRVIEEDEKGYDDAKKVLIINL